MLFRGVIKCKDGCGPFKSTLWVALASTCLNLCAGTSSKSKGTNHQVVLLLRDLSDLSHSLGFMVPESTVLGLTHGAWTDKNSYCH